MHKLGRLLVATAAFAVLALLSTTATAAIDTTPPVWKKLPTSSMPVGAELWPAGSWDDGCTYIGMQINLAWRADDPESGIDHYGYAHEVDETDVPNMGTSTKGIEYAYVDDNVCGGGASGTEFYAFNGAGLWAWTHWGADRLDIIQDDNDWWPAADFGPYQPGPGDPHLTYSRDWSTSACNCWTDGTTQKTTKSAASVTLSIPSGYGGTHGVGVVMAKGPDRGKAAIFVDGARVATVDTYSATKVNRTVVWRQALPAWDHEVKIVNLATPGRPRIDVDAFVLVRK